MPHGFASPASLPSGESTDASGVVRQAVTANRLRDGVPVYFGGGGHWSPAIDDAAHVATEAAESLLGEAQAGPVPLPVVAPYLIETTFAEGHLRPVSLREQIRAFGPTVRPPRR